MTILRCPICDQRFESADTNTAPFCSARCRQVDLGRWLNEDYGLPYERLNEQEPDWEQEEQ